MGPYIVPGIPSMLTVHEAGVRVALELRVRSKARLPRPRSLATSISSFRSFHYSHERTSHRCAITSSRSLKKTPRPSPRSSDARVYTSPAGSRGGRGTRSFSPSPIGARPFSRTSATFSIPRTCARSPSLPSTSCPRSCVAIPAPSFVSTGRVSARRSNELDGKNGVRVEGFVDDLRAALRAATAMVAPLYTGTGMRIKVMEAFGAGTLVIGTDLSVRGLPVVDNRKHFFRANAVFAEAFVRAITRAFESPGEASAVARAGQELVSAYHGWDETARRRVAIWHTVVAEGNRSPVLASSKKAVEV